MNFMKGLTYPLQREHRTGPLSPKSTIYNTWEHEELESAVSLNQV